MGRALRVRGGRIRRCRFLRSRCGLLSTWRNSYGRGIFRGAGMISRRGFIGCGSAAAVWAATGSRFAEATPLGLPLGIQLYSVRQQLQQDYDKTLAEVASVGYKEVEAAGFYNHTAAQVKASMQKAG